MTEIGPRTDEEKEIPLDPLIPRLFDVLILLHLHEVLHGRSVANSVEKFFDFAPIFFSFPFYSVFNRLLHLSKFFLSFYT